MTRHWRHGVFLQLVAVLAFAGCCASASAQTTNTAPRAELRGVWFSGGEILKPRGELTKHFETLRQANLNMVAVNMLYDGLAPYPGSQFLPLHPSYKGWADVPRQAFELIEQAGMAGLILAGDGFVMHKIYRKYPDALGPVLERRRELAQMDTSGSIVLGAGKSALHGLCPSNPASHEFLAGLYAEAALRYKPDGFVLGGFHYWSKNHCACRYCREHFEKDTGCTIEARDFKSTESRAWTSWKRKQLARGMKAISKSVRAARPGIRLLAYGQTKRDRDEKAQSWDTWLKDGSVDYVILAMYDKDISATLNAMLRIKGVKPSQLVAGLSASVPTPDLLRNVELVRSKGLAGHVFYVSRNLGNDDLFGLMDGPYAQPATIPPPRTAGGKKGAKP